MAHYRYFATFVHDDYWYCNGKLIGWDAERGNTLEQLRDQICLCRKPHIKSKMVDGKKEYTLKQNFISFGGKYCLGIMALIEDRDVVDEEGNPTIVYSNGFFTDGKKIITKEVEEWLDHFEKTIDEPAKITFVTYSEDGTAVSHSIPVSTTRKD